MMFDRRAMIFLVILLVGVVCAVGLILIISG